MKSWLLCFLASAQFVAFSDVLIPLNSQWRYFKGTSEPPADWREVTYADNVWSSGIAPIYYGEDLGPGTVLTDMRTNYSTIYARHAFTLADPAAIDRLALRVFVDDGFVAWINGHEVARFNVPAGDLAFDAVAQGTIEPTWVTNSIALTNQELRSGANLLALHVFNRPITSSDLVFDFHLESSSNSSAPTISSIDPIPGRVSELTSITVRFSEEVQGVRAEDFLVNNTPAREVTGAGATYTFTFNPPAFGPVDVTWNAGHQITDLANPPLPFDESSFAFQYVLADETSALLASIVPPPNTTIRNLSAVEVQFSEIVTNIQAADMKLNGVGATNLLARPANVYIFQFPSQPNGPAVVTWSNDHAITDLALNRFNPTSWSYIVDASLPLAQVVISEFLASAENSNGLKDEDNELQDWLELYNSGTTSVNLTGWSLTDDPEEPGLWIFPDVTLPAGGRLVVFASAKDRKATTAGARLHTNFKLTAGGEYLALFDSGSPRVVMTEFIEDYPEQRNDYSYGLDASGAWRYFQAPTPGLANGSSVISGVVPKPGVSSKRGWYDVPFTLYLTNDLPGTTIRYTTDGSVPTETTGTIFTGSLQVVSNLVLRAAAFRANHLPSEVITHTYLFADKVLLQPNTPAGFPAGPTVHAGYPSDYEMDPEIVNDPAYASQMIAALKALPIISITMRTDDMFGAANGIYTHPLSRGPQWERPCSIEFIPLSGDDFQENAGIQIQGNAAREPQKQPKHPLRVTFKGDYGSKTLDYKLFPDSPVSSFDTLILRADFNFSWLHWNPTQRLRAQRTRDAWVKDTMREMGGLASHNRYVNLFINGLYWGIYDPSERPDGSFGEAYLGGKKEDYDVINEGAVVDGTATAYNALLSFTDLSTIPQYESIKQYLDLPQFIDYMLLHFYMGHEDWGNNKNWYNIRPRDGSRGFLYIPWDGEMVLGDLGANRVSNPDVPSGLHTKLLTNEQYKLDFADRVHRHFFNNGSLTPSQNIARWQKRSREIELPIIAESARWGDYRRDVHRFQNPPYELYTRDDHWSTEQRRLLNSYFPNRTTAVLNQLRTAGLYPSVAAPTFSQHGGRIVPGYQLQMAAASGTILYTTDGSDPRTYGSGTVSSNARTYLGPLNISSTTHIKARVLFAGSWSALTEAVFSADSPRIPLRITEIMYNPDPAGDAFEFIELQYLGSLPLDVGGFYLEGVDYIFPPKSILNPGQIVVLGSSENPATFALRYPGLTVLGRFGGQLLNRGERLALAAPNGRTVHSVDFDDDSGWPGRADGGGASLEVLNPLGDPDDPANWHASVPRNGTPGAINSTPPSSPLSFSEAFAAGDASSDWIEIFAPAELELGGWLLSEAGTTNVFVFPIDSVATAGTYLTVAMGGPKGTHNFLAPFALDSDGEALLLTDTGGNVRDIFTYGPQAKELSTALISGRLALARPTPRSANEPFPAPAASLRINELLANPLPGENDWIEIYNFDVVNPASLQGCFVAISNQVFEITSAAFVAPGGFARLFADEQPGPNHLDLKLSAAGGTVRLLDPTGELLDEISYPFVNEAASYGRFPDGSTNLMMFSFPTPKASNAPGFPVEVVSAAGGEVQLSWPSRIGNRYRIEFSEALGTWNTLAEIDAPGAVTSARDSLDSRQKYYRVVILP